jgi:quercetin dioxygenase-like cupin family protein
VKGDGVKTVTHKRLLDLEPEALNPLMTRRMLWGDRLMASYLEFKKGAVVPVHQHENEQLTYCLSGQIKFTLPDRGLVLRPGEVLLIPGNVPHGAEFPEDTVEMDFFSPPRQDWINRSDSYLRTPSQRTQR